MDTDHIRQRTILSILSKFDEPAGFRDICKELKAIEEDDLYASNNSFKANTCNALNQLDKRNLIDVLILPIPPKYKKTRRYYSINSEGISELAKANIKAKMKSKLLAVF